METFDSYLGIKFRLKAMCIWRIHYFLTYNLFKGFVTKAHVGCPLVVLVIKEAKKKWFIMGCVTTLALGSQPRQGHVKVRAKKEAWESHFMLPGVWEYGRM